YRLVRLLGRGGMGEVHLAVQEGDDFERTVAVKLIRRGAESDELALRFRQERRILARLRHDHIAGLLDGGTDDDGTLYVVMEFVDGRRIDRYCDDRGLDVAARVRLMLDVCDAVQHAHRNLVLHRDLKPANILVTDDGVAKLLDFGIAKLLDGGSPESAPLTRTDHRVLTPEYAAPEQIRGEEATTASDVFALGVVLYELLAGVHPWASVTPHERLSAIEYGPPSRPSEVVTGSTADTSRRRRRLSGDLDTILLKALRAEPHRRYPTVDALADDLRRHLDGRPVSARPDTLGYRTSRFVRRNRTAVTAASVVILTLLGATSTVAVQRSRTAARVEDERDKLVATRDFLLEMFGAVGPDEVGGGEVSARALLDAQAERVADYADRPELQAEVQYVLADGYQRLGLVDDARPLAAASLATRRETLGSDHPDVARSQGLLGWIERERGDRPAAEELLRAAVAAARGSDDPAAAGLAKSLNDLGVTLGDLGRHGEAVEVFQEALSLREVGTATSNAGGRGIGITTNNLANAHWALGEQDEAVRLMERSVEALEAALGGEHGRVWLARANLLAFRTETLPGEERIEAWREHRAGAEALFGANHRETARATQYLAAYLLQNLPGPEGGAARVSEARALYDEALEVAETTFGAEHPRTADMLVGRSHSAMLLRDYPSAIADRERAVQIFRSAQGDDAPEIGLALREIARAWYGLGDGEAGDRVAREALDHFRRTLGPTHSSTLSQQVNVARRMTVTGDPAGAVPLLREAAAGMETLDPTPVPVLAQTRIALALALLRSGEPSEAVDLLDALRPNLESLPTVVQRQFEQVEAEVGGAG
ncbi:MAG: serine/threonine-protein kinase, partial [Gemmatimonadetes bacterium]|nr:serine/threonine-protein kinase [Gemmatimonadota bacterium]